MISLNARHKSMVKDLVKDGATIADEMTPDSAHILHMSVGVAGEAGELLDAIKKAVIYQKELDRENVIEELGDLEFYIEGLRESLNITRDETLDANIRKLGVRYGDKYSDKSAQNREDKK